MNSQEYPVIVYCLTYNHERYVEQTLEGFVKQKTSFPFRVIVHDDASTDSTRSIIQRYAEKYPDLIFPIFQEENQHSQGISIYYTYILPLLNCEYVACCEGDDYWCCADKLQKQYDYMNENPRCTLCVHNSRIILEDGQLTDRWFNYSCCDNDYTVDDVIRAKGGGLFHTSSFFFRAKDAIIPQSFRIQGIGDYSSSIYRAFLGYVHYFHDTMSCYRTGSVNSWVKGIHENNNKIIEFNLRLIVGLQHIGEVIGKDHKGAISSALRQYSLDNFLYMNSRWRVFLTPKQWLPCFERIVREKKMKVKRQRFLCEYEKEVD